MVVEAWPPVRDLVLTFVFSVAVIDLTSSGIMTSSKAAHAATCGRRCSSALGPSCDHCLFVHVSVYLYVCLQADVWFTTLGGLIFCRRPGCSRPCGSS